MMYVFSYRSTGYTKSENCSSNDISTCGHMSCTAHWVMACVHGQCTCVENSPENTRKI